MNARTNTNKPARRQAAPPQAARAQQESPLDRKMRNFASAIGSKQKALARLLPKAFTPERMVTLMIESARKTPDILGCSEISVMSSMFEAAKLELEPDTSAGLCYLIPYKGECTLQLGYRGLVVLACRNTELSHVEAFNVYDCDQLELGIDDPVFIMNHMRPADAKYVGTLAVGRWKDPNRPKPWVYVPAEGPDSMATVEAHALGCDVSQLEARHKKGGSKPWFRWRDAMRQKTAIKRLCRRVLPAYDVTVHRALTLDDKAESRISQMSPDMFDGSFASVPKDDAVDTTAVAGNDVKPLPPEPEPDPTPAEDKSAKVDALVAELTGAGIDEMAIDAAVSTAEDDDQAIAALEQLRSKNKAK